MVAIVRRSEQVIKAIQQRQGEKGINASIKSGWLLEAGGVYSRGFSQEKRWEKSER